MPAAPTRTVSRLPRYATPGATFRIRARPRHRNRHLGGEQKAWFLDKLKNSRATWKIWGHSLRNAQVAHRRPESPAKSCPRLARRGICPVQRRFLHRTQRDLRLWYNTKGSPALPSSPATSIRFWAGMLSKGLPPETFEPLGVEFITGSISAPGLFEVAEYTIAADDPLLPLLVQTVPTEALHLQST